MRDLLAPLAAEPKVTGIFCDFDGSLAPIVQDPAMARPVKGAGEALHDLAKRFKLVAVVSGRPVAFLSSQLEARGVRLVGLYGIEERVGRSLRVLPEAQKARGAILAAEQRLRSMLDPSIFIEPKGFALSIHVRRVNDPEGAMRDAEPIVRGVAEEQGLHVSSGRLVWELSPPAGAQGKGDVVRRCIEHHGIRRALVAGDDRGDLAAFRALDGLEVAIRVGVESSEMPDELRAESDVIVDGPASLVELFRELRRLVD
jgi:trehalose 6-phosphate phosphatase